MVTLIVPVLDSPPIREVIRKLPNLPASMPYGVVARKTVAVNTPEGEVPRFCTVKVTETGCPLVTIDGAAVTEGTVRSIVGAGETTVLVWKYSMFEKELPVALRTSEPDKSSDRAKTATITANHDLFLLNFMSLSPPF
jgi:hypothetical protein